MKIKPSEAFVKTYKILDQHCKRIAQFYIDFRKKCGLNDLMYKNFFYNINSNKITLVFRCRYFDKPFVHPVSELYFSSETMNLDFPIEFLDIENIEEIEKYFEVKT